MLAMFWKSEIWGGEQIIVCTFVILFCIIMHIDR